MDHRAATTSLLDQEMLDLQLEVWVSHWPWIVCLSEDAWCETSERVVIRIERFEDLRRSDRTESWRSRNKRSIESRGADER